LKDDAKKKKESLEKLMNQYEQAKINGDTDLMKKIKAVIERVKNGPRPKT
jgi:hypothetical protein